MQSLQRLPPFINDKFALSVIVKLGQPTGIEIKDFVRQNYDLSTCPHALQYVMTQLSALTLHGYLGRTKGKENRFFIVDEARPIIERMLKE